MKLQNCSKQTFLWLCLSNGRAVAQWRAGQCPSSPSLPIPLQPAANPFSGKDLMAALSWPCETCDPLKKLTRCMLNSQSQWLEVNNGVDGEKKGKKKVRKQKRKGKRRQEEKLKGNKGWGKLKVKRKRKNTLEQKEKKDMERAEKRERE